MIEMGNDEEMRRLALLGARALLEKIDSEREHLMRLFPELGRKPRGSIAKASEPTILFDASDRAESNGEHGRRARRSHGPEVRAEALARFRRGEYLSDVARALDIRASVIKRWADAARVKITPMSTEEKIRRWQEAKAEQHAADDTNHKSKKGK